MAIKNKPDFAFGKNNYLLMIVGLVVITTGFVMMSGGGIDDPSRFSNEIFSTRRITLAPIVVTIGFIIEIFAVMQKPKG